jgi:hypothetical protein
MWLGKAGAKTDRRAETSQTTTRDILTAAMELFYDRYAATSALVIGDEVERLEALQLVPRREERRGKSDAGGGTGSGGGTGA